MDKLTIKPNSKRLFRANTIILAFIFSFAGCASIPKNEKSNSVKSVSSYKTNTLIGNAGKWPSEQWWNEYGDKQLDSLINEAIANSPNMAVASARLRRAEAFRQVSKSSTMPQVSADAAVSSQKMSYNYLTPQQMTPQGWNDYGQASLNFSFEIDFWGKNKSALAAATSELYAAEAEAAGAKIVIISAITSNYAVLAQMYDARDVTLEEVRTRQDILKLFEGRYKNGLETKASIARARAGLLAFEGELLALDERIALQKNILAELVATGPDGALTIERPTIKIGLKIGVPDNLAMELLGRRPDIVSAKNMVEAYTHRISQKKAEFYPNVNLSAFIGVQSLGIDKLTKSGSDIGGVGPAISLPIFTAGRLEGELRSVEAGYDEAVASYDKVLSGAFSEVASTLISQRALSEQIKKAKETLNASNEAYLISINRYKHGVGNYIEVLYANESLLASKKNLVLLESKALTLDVALKKALGGGYKNNTQG